MDLHELIPGEKDRKEARQGGSRTFDKDGNEIKPTKSKPAAQPAAEKKPKKDSSS